MASSIRIFPTSNRSNGGINDLGTNLVTEYNIASLINQILDIPGFVVNEPGKLSSGSLVFNSNGYVFELNNDLLANIVAMGDEYNAAGADFGALTYIRFGRKNNNEYFAIFCIIKGTSLSYNYLSGADDTTSTNNTPYDDNIINSFNSMEYNTINSSSIDGVILVKSPLLFKYENNSKIIPEESTLKFTKKSISFDEGILS